MTVKIHNGDFKRPEEYVSHVVEFMSRMLSTGQKFDRVRLEHLLKASVACLVLKPTDTVAIPEVEPNYFPGIKVTKLFDLYNQKCLEKETKLYSDFLFKKGTELGKKISGITVIIYITTFIHI